ncbi:MAG: hypothetical protein J7647_29895 [Cyanobacteria bacterium SBLK]|nr:hypothetical protein [Cyanobacteria bacterium SBLK]
MTFTETETFTPLPDHTQLPCEVWQGMYQNLELRWWDSEGNLLPSAEERADLAELELQQLRDRLKAANINPDNL